MLEQSLLFVPTSGQFVEVRMGPDGAEFLRRRRRLFCNCLFHPDDLFRHG